jgi:hypothetical protein
MEWEISVSTGRLRGDVYRNFENAFHCTACGHEVYMNKLIARRDGGDWLCMGCVKSAVRDALWSEA